MNTKKILTFAVIGFAGYWIYTRTKQKKSINPFAKSNSFDAESSYFNAIGKPKKKTVYIAGGYDPSHVNPDGTRGATWMSYGGAGVSGYWVSGYVPSGTVTQNLGDRP